MDSYIYIWKQVNKYGKSVIDNTRGVYYSCTNYNKNGGIIMGRRGVEIIDLNVNELISKLNQALAEEWLAYYQYWIGAKVMEGPMRGDIEKELLVHADQELNHATMVVERITQLNGTPVLTPADWLKLSHCAYGTPEDPYIEKILNQNLDGERCAIETYNNILRFTSGKDFATYDMALFILKEELEHEQEIEDWLTDIEHIKKELKSGH
jgi:bacterioferritin